MVLPCMILSKTPLLFDNIREESTKNIMVAADSAIYLHTVCTVLAPNSLIELCKSVNGANTPTKLVLNTIHGAIVDRVVRS